MKPILLAAISFVVGLLVLPLVVYLYLSFGKPPVAAADTPFPSKRDLSRFRCALESSGRFRRPRPLRLATRT